MNKVEFLALLHRQLKSLPRADLERTIDYYSEIIDDRIEAGESEENAVLSVGSAEEIVAQALAERKPQKTIAKNEQQLIVLIAGAPLWIPLAIAALAIILSVYVTVWSIVASVAIVEASFLIAAPLGVIWGIVGSFAGSAVFGMLLIGGSLSLAAIALVSMLPVIALIEYSVKLTKISVVKMIKAVGGR